MSLDCCSKYSIQEVSIVANKDFFTGDIFAPFHAIESEKEAFLNTLTSIDLQPVKISGDFALGLVEWYEEVLKKAGEIIGKWEKFNGMTNICRPECDSCCYHLIEIYNYELLTILTHLKSTNQEQLFKNALGLTNMFEKNLPPSPYKQDNPSEKELIKYKIKYRSLHIPCMFLQDKKCTIYKIRPSCCATYFSYGLQEDCLSQSGMPQDCISYGSIEDWIVRQIDLFLTCNKNKVPIGFAPFNIGALPILISDYISKKV